MKSAIAQVNDLISDQSDAVKAYLADKSIPLEERWVAAQSAEVFLDDDASMCGIEALIVGGEIDWYDSMNVDRHQTVLLIDDDFLDHFLVCSTEKVEVKKLYTIHGEEFDEMWHSEEDIDHTKTKTSLEFDYGEGIYCNSPKLKQGITRDDLKEAILATGSHSYHHDW